MDSGFYRAFEDRHRGSREMIKSRLRVYLPFVEALKTIYKECRVVDLGCGRGEWLELLSEVGVDPFGVDLDDGMLAACRERGLKVETGDAIQFLKSLPDQSQTIVSAFHFVEHIPFAALQTLVQQSLRVLKPGGLLILETPNPENIAVGTANFYSDPTHIHPIPQQLLSFLPEYFGFFRTKVLRLQEAPDLTERKPISLIDVLSGVSPDYSIVAQKNASPEFRSIFDRLFQEEHGVTLETLAARYDAQSKNKDQYLEGVRADLKVVRDERDRLQAIVNDISEDRERIRAALYDTMSDRERIRASLNDAMADRERIRASLNDTTADRERIRASLNDTIADREQIWASLNQAISEREQIQKQLNELVVERDKDRSELATKLRELDASRAEVETFRNQYINVLYSKSYRITAPLRSFLHLSQNLKKRMRGTSVHPEVTNNKLISPPNTSLSTPFISNNDQTEDEKYFLEFFKREISKRNDAKGGRE